MKHQDLREEVARIARQMISGLVTGTSGNVSTRTPEGDVLITPSGLDYGQLEPGNIVLVDLEKNVLEGALEPSSEIPMHTGIYRARPQVDAVVHTHDWAYDIVARYRYRVFGRFEQCVLPRPEQRKRFVDY